MRKVSTHVILSVAKNRPLAFPIRQFPGILRYAQNDMSEGLFHGMTLGKEHNLGATTCASPYHGCVQVVGSRRELR